eukprot:3021942-Rhodomonas_salina.1
MAMAIHALEQGDNNVQPPSAPTAPVSHPPPPLFFIIHPSTLHVSGTDERDCQDYSGCAVQTLVYENAAEGYIDLARRGPVPEANTVLKDSVNNPVLGCRIQHGTEG